MHDRFAFFGFLHFSEEFSLAHSEACSLFEQLKNKLSQLLSLFFIFVSVDRLVLIILTRLRSLISLKIK